MAPNGIRGCLALCARQVRSILAPMKNGFFDTLFVALQYLLPKQAMTQLAGAFARRPAGRLTYGVIRWFIGRYGVNMAEAEKPTPEDYPSFNAFFTRQLLAGVRPLATAELICPVDGAISQVGAIDGDQIFQAKGHSYSTTALVGGDLALAQQFNGGHFATIYLSPKDYHRIHMPCDGRLLKMIYVPGALFSVNPATARGVPGLFARNERVVCVFETAYGPLVLALVGATIVGSMATVWHGLVNPPRSKTVRQWDYAGDSIFLRQGEEMGRFLLGSTVVLLWPASSPKQVSAAQDASTPTSWQWNPNWAPGKTVRLGEAMASRAT